MNKPLKSALEKLRQSEGELSSSRLTPAQRNALDSFARSTGSINIISSGRGQVFKTVKPNIVEQHWQNLTPVENEQIDDSLPGRAINIAQSRSSKSAQYGHSTHYLLIKAQGSVIWYDANGDVLNLTQITQHLGAAALAIQNDCQSDSGLYTDVPLWLVENQAVFDRLDWLPNNQGHCVAYYSGHLRDDLISWLRVKQRTSKLWFFPDYDGVGLLNYLRIKEQLGKQVQLWLMPDWEKKLNRFGSTELWQNPKQLQQFQSAQQRLSKVDMEPEVMALFHQMQTQGLALEQEAVWLDIE